MLNFREWLLAKESSPTTRALSEPWAYPALYVGGDPFADTNSPQTLKNYKGMIRRDTKRKRRKKKVARKPDNSIDGFVQEMELLKKDLAALGEKKKKDQETAKDSGGKPNKPVKQEVDDDLLKVAKIVLANLKGAPNFYSRLDRLDKHAGLDRRKSLNKLSRKDVQDVAKRLGIDFGSVRFTPDAFRRAIEFEVDHKVSPGDPSPPRRDPVPRDRGVVPGKGGKPDLEVKPTPN